MGWTGVIEVKMAKKPSYSEKLKDPRWQKRRLEIMERAKFRCELCTHDKNMLQIHHKFYQTGKEPWEYGSDALICVCEDCHDIVSKVERELLSAFPPQYYDTLIIIIQILQGLRDNNLSIENFRAMLSAFNRCIPLRKESDGSLDKT